MNDTAPPSVITTARTRLVLVTAQDAAAMLSGQPDQRWHREYPRPDDLDAVALVGRGRPEGEPWGPRHLVCGREAVGSIGFFGDPVDAEVEVGFRLVPSARGDGIAAEALAGLMAETDRLGVTVRAAVAPENRAGLRTLAVCGFTAVRGSNEDGHLVMARPIRQVTP